jgi:hypothetical protein
LKNIIATALAKLVEIEREKKGRERNKITNEQKIII